VIVTHPTTPARPPLAVLLGALACILLAAALTGWIVAASQFEGVIQGFARILSQPWGVVGMIDLYAGLFIVALWMAAVEARRGLALALVLLLPLLGNVVPLVYLVARARGARSFQGWLLERR